jgi:phosphoribosylamine---glycine ligase
VILPRIAVPLGPLLLAAARGRLPAEVPALVPTLPGATVGIVLASEGYPGRSQPGRAIDGIDVAVQDSLVFHMGTRRGTAGWETAGGRVVTIVGRGSDIEPARHAAERAAGTITWPGMQRRRDIGASVVAAVR